MSAQETFSHPSAGDLNQHFGKFIVRFGGDAARMEQIGSALSRAVQTGHLCLDLKAPFLGETGSPSAWPSYEEWLAILEASSAVEIIGSTDKGAASCGESNQRPLVLDSAGRLYLRRYFDYEQALARALLSRAQLSPPPTGNASLDDQQNAIETALGQRLTLVSGGPGTGKTTTVVRILIRLLEEEPHLRIALTAPTGKAAARLEQAVRVGMKKHPGAAASIPPASTLHRLLGARSGSLELKHHAENPLPVDVLVVDEASMIPLPLMAKLFDALTPEIRVILLGDQDQLASVDPGSVLADIAAAAAEANSPLKNSLTTLRKNYRFGNESGIYKLAEAVRAGNAAETWQILQENASTASSSLSLRDLSFSPLPTPSHLTAQLGNSVIKGFRGYLEETEPQRALELFQRFRVLTPVRQGPYGVEELNRHIRAVLVQAGLQRRETLAGMPVLITANDYHLRLFNGDIGILLPEPGIPNGPLWAWFTNDNPQAAEGERALRKIPPTQLPKYEAAFAMTVHKSQGSEFDEVLLILPEKDTPVLTRELIYTGITRAKKHASLWLNPPVFHKGILRQTERTSGLRDALRPNA